MASICGQQPTKEMVIWIQQTVTREMKLMIRRDSESRVVPFQDLKTSQRLFFLKTSREQSYLSIYGVKIRVVHLRTTDYY